MCMPGLGGVSGVFGQGTGLFGLHGASAGCSGGEMGDATCNPSGGPSSAYAARPSSCESMPSVKLTKSSKASPPEKDDAMAAGGGAERMMAAAEQKNTCLAN